MNERQSIDSICMRLLRENKRFAFAALDGKLGTVALCIEGEPTHHELLSLSSLEAAQIAADKLNTWYEFDEATIKAIIDAVIKPDAST